MVSSFKVKASFTESTSSGGQNVELTLNIELENGDNYLKVTRPGSNFAIDDNNTQKYPEFKEYEPNGLDWYFHPMNSSPIKYKFKGNKKLIRNITLDDFPPILSFSPEELDDSGISEIGIENATNGEIATIEACLDKHAVVFIGQKRIETVDVFNVSYFNKNNTRLVKPTRSYKMEEIVGALNEVYSKVNVSFVPGETRDLVFENLDTNRDGCIEGTHETNRLANHVRTTYYNGNLAYNDRVVVFRVNKIGKCLDIENVLKTINGRAGTLGGFDHSFMLSTSTASKSTISHEAGHAIFGMEHPRHKLDIDYNYGCDIDNIMYFTPNRSDTQIKDGVIIDHACGGISNLRGNSVRHLDWRLIHN